MRKASAEGPGVGDGRPGRAPAPAKREGWLRRHPGLLALAGAAGALGLFQAAFLIARVPFASDARAFVGLGGLGLVSGLLTVLVLSPLVLWLRRFHPEWRQGDRLAASWAAACGLTVAVAAWMLADLWARAPLVPGRLAPWIEVGVAATCGLAATRLALSRRWIAGLAVAGLAAFGLTFWPLPGGPPGGEGETPAAAPPASPVSGIGPSPAGEAMGRPDVILVSIDTLRADCLGAYGGAPSMTPEIDRLALEGTVFERAVASSPWTVPSVASMLTGLPTLSHGAGRPLGSGPTLLRSPLDEEKTTLAERFAAAGYRTRAVNANGFLSAEGGFAQGFERFENPFNSAMLAGFLRDVPLARLVLSFIPAERLGDFRARGVTDRALAFLAEESERPLFLWAHYMDPHSPLQADPDRLDPVAMMGMVDQKHPPVLPDGTVVGEFFVATDLVRGGSLWLGPEDRRRLREYYDRTVAYMDEHLGRLFAALRERRRDRPVVVLLTADHGEEFWDHGQYEHGHDYYREVTRVPLVLWGPGIVPEGRRGELAGLVDVAPTLLDLAGLPAPSPGADDEGRSLVSAWSGTGSALPPAPRFAGGNLYGLPAVLVEDGPWRSILRANGALELYDAHADPSERRDLSGERPEDAERLRQLLEPRLTLFLATSGGPREQLSPETLRALEALGYL